MNDLRQYEFLAIDRLLTAEERAAIENISSRTTVTPSSAVFTYNYKSFPGDEGQVLAQYFDAMAFISSWGWRRLMFRFPLDAIDFHALNTYALDKMLYVRRQDRYVIADILPYREEASPEWLDEQNRLGPMVPLRADLMAGDYRTLYLAWLSGVEAGHLGDDVTEPPVPAGLQHLDSSHQALIDFFGIDRDLVKAAAAASPPPADVPSFDPRACIDRLSPEEKNDFLLRVACHEPGLGYALQRRLREVSGQADRKDHPGHRTVGELIRLSVDARNRRIATEKAEAEIARRRKLDKIAGQKDALWTEAHNLVERRQAKYYREAVSILLDLRAAAEFRGELPAFERSLAQFSGQFGRLHSLQAQLRSAGLLARAKRSQ